MNFKTEIEDLAGSTSSTANLENFINAGVRDVVHRVLKNFPDHITMFATTSSISDSGTSLHDTHILNVHRNSKNATKIDAIKRFSALDSGSIDYATASDPVYYILNDKIYVLPSGGSTVEYSHTTESEVTNYDASNGAIANFPHDHYDAVVLFAAIRLIQHKMVEMHNDSGISDALTEAAAVINGNSPSASTDAFGALGNEDIELVSSAISTAQAVLGEVQTRVGNLAQEYQWYTSRLQDLKTQYETLWLAPPQAQ